MVGAGGGVGALVGLADMGAFVTGAMDIGALDMGANGASVCFVDMIGDVVGGGMSGRGRIMSGPGTLGLGLGLGGDV